MGILLLESPYGHVQPLDLLRFGAYQVIDSFYLLGEEGQLVFVLSDLGLCLPVVLEFSLDPHVPYFEVVSLLDLSSEHSVQPVDLIVQQ